MNNSVFSNGSRLSLSHKLKSAVYVLFSVLAFRPHKNGFWTHQNAGGFQKRSSEYIVQSRDFGKRRLLVYVWTDEKLSDPEIRGAQSQKRIVFGLKIRGVAAPRAPPLDLSLPRLCSVCTEWNTRKREFSSGRKVVRCRLNVALAILHLYTCTARASLSFVHFFSITTWLRCEKCLVSCVSGGRKQATNKFAFYSCTWVHCSKFISSRRVRLHLTKLVNITERKRVQRFLSGVFAFHGSWIRSLPYSIQTVESFSCSLVCNTS